MGELEVVALVLSGTFFVVAGVLSLRLLWRRLARWALVFALVLGWLTLLPVLGEADLFLLVVPWVPFCALVCGPLLLELVVHSALWPTRLLAPYNRGARRKLGGHWERYAEPCGLSGMDGWTFRWEQVQTCHRAGPCLAAPPGTGGAHGGNCPLLICEHWDYRVGPEDNIVGPDDPTLVPRLEQQQHVLQIAQEMRVAYREWQAEGSIYDLRHHDP